MSKIYNGLHNEKFEIFVSFIKLTVKNKKTFFFEKFVRIENHFYFVMLQFQKLKIYMKAGI